ncbi:MAG: TRAP transporter permease [Clostridiales bacterium]|nr:TRAP transporter permease [Clostridiales bacterium]
MKSNENRIYEIMIIVVSLAMAIFHIYTATFGVLTALLQRSIHLGFGLTIIYLLAMREAKSIINKIISLIALIFGLAAIFYLGFNFESLTIRFGQLTFFDILFGTALILVVLDVTRRVLGWTLPTIAIFFLVYAFIGPYLPGILEHRGYSLNRIINQLYLTTTGIFGVPMGVSANYIFLFMLMGGFLVATGAGDFYIDIANAAFGRSRGGPGKVAVMARALFGTNSGSGVANVVSTGAVTIPLMKRLGYEDDFSSAIVAAASTGGQIMPPVMGSAAFVMAEFMGVPYYEVVKAAFITAAIYFISMYMTVHFEAVRLNLGTIRSEETLKLKEILRSRWFYSLPLVVLTILLIAFKWTPMKVGVYTIAVTIGVGLWGKRGEFGVKEIIDAIKKSAKTSLIVISSCATAGIVIGIISLTGLGLKFSSLMIAGSGGSMYLLLILVMLSSVVLGMGLSTTPAYLILAVLAAPAIEKIGGVSTMAAHMFVFYFGCLSLITPPVATASYAAAGIAGCNPIKTGITATRIALPAFIVPYLFVSNQALLFQGTLFNIAVTMILAIVSAIAFSAAIVGWFVTETTIYERILLFVAAIVMIDQNIITTLIGLIVFGVIALIQSKRKGVLNSKEKQSLKEA